jgi:hypothetical protein
MGISRALDKVDLGLRRITMLPDCYQETWWYQTKHLKEIEWETSFFNNLICGFVQENQLWLSRLEPGGPSNLRIYHLVMTNSLPWKDPPFLIGKPSINGPFSMAMLNNQMVPTIYWKIMEKHQVEHQFANF